MMIMEGVLKSFSSYATEYSPEWYEGMVISGGVDLALDLDYRALPFVVRLGLYGGVVEDFFDVKKQCCWRVEVLVFGSDVDMVEWLCENEACDVVFLSEEYQMKWDNDLKLSIN